MTTESVPVVILDNLAASRFEARVGGAFGAYCEYETAEGVIVLVYTEVLPQFAGQGLGGKLAAGLLDDVRRRGLAVIPACPFIRSYIERHPQYQELVLPE